MRLCVGSSKIVEMEYLTLRCGHLSNAIGKRLLRTKALPVITLVITSILILHIGIDPILCLMLTLKSTTNAQTSAK